MKTRNWIFGLAVLAVAFTGCKDDDDDDNKSSSNLTNAQKLSRSWKVTSAVLEFYDNNQLIASEDIYAQNDDCDNDDVTTFNADGTYLISEGASKCDPSFSDTVEVGTWAFNSAQTQLYLTPDNWEADTFDIVSLSATQAKMTQTDQDGTETYVGKITFSAI